MRACPWLALVLAACGPSEKEQLAAALAGECAARAPRLAALKLADAKLVARRDAAIAGCAREAALARMAAAKHAAAVDAEVPNVDRVTDHGAIRDAYASVLVAAAGAGDLDGALRAYEERVARGVLIASDEMRARIARACAAEACFARANALLRAIQWRSPATSAYGEYLDWLVRLRRVRELGEAIDDVACVFPSVANFRESMKTGQGMEAARLITTFRDRANALRRDLGQPARPAPKEEPFCTDPERDARRAGALAGAP